MLFSKEHRPKIKEDNPDITFGQIGKKLGEMWRALDEKEKQAYKASASCCVMGFRLLVVCCVGS